MVDGTRQVVRRGAQLARTPQITLLPRPDGPAVKARRPLGPVVDALLGPAAPRLGADAPQQVVRLSELVPLGPFLRLGLRRRRSFAERWGRFLEEAGQAKAQQARQTKQGTGKTGRKATSKKRGRAKAAKQS